MIIASVILAAGPSTRMGLPKQLLPYEGRPLLLRTIDIALASKCGPVFVVLGAHADLLRPHLQSLPVHTIENPAYLQGIGSSIAAAVRVIQSLSPPVDAILLLLADQPLITSDLLDRIAAACLAGHPLVACQYAQTLGPPALFARQFFTALANLPPDEGAKSLLLKNRDLVHSIPFPDAALDIDTPADLTRLPPHTHPFRPGSFPFSLSDGTPVLLAPVLPEDRQRIRAGLARMSSASRYLRFFAHTPTLSDEQLRFLTEIDQVNHVAWCALDPSTSGLDGLAMGRFVRLDDQPDTAEFALAVIDARQRRGLASILLAVLYLLARTRRIRTLRGLILPENDFLRRWLHDLGASSCRQTDFIQADLPVRPDPADLPRTPSAQTFSALLRVLAPRLPSPP